MSFVAALTTQAERESTLTGGRRQRGYTLFELLITLMIISILATTVGPNFADAIGRSRQQAALGDMFSMLSTARSEAVNQASAAVACASTDQSGCSGLNWEDGWIVFVDNGNGGGTAADGTRQTNEPLIRVGGEASGDVTIRTRNFADAGVITFDQDGLAAERGTIVVCNGDASEASGIVLNLSGQPRMAVDEDSPANNFVDADDGSEVNTCP